MAKHDAYLRSPAWQAKRADYRRNRKWACLICGAKRGIQLHHLTYDRLGDEDLDDLVPLCQGCHVIVHEHARQHPELDLRAATYAARQHYRCLRTLTQRKQEYRKTARKARRQANRPHIDWAERLGLEPGQTKIRIQPK